MPRLPSLLCQLHSLNKRIGQLNEEMPDPEDCAVASPALMRAMILRGELMPLVDRRTGVLRRLRYTARRRLEDNRWATAMVFAGQQAAMLKFLSDVAIENPQVAQDLGWAGGAQLAHLVRLHLAPLAEQVAPNAPAPWVVMPVWARELSAGLGAVSVSAPSWKRVATTLESLPRVQTMVEDPVPVRDLKTRRRNGREVA